MNRLLKGLAASLTVWLLRRYRDDSLDLMRLKAATGYLRVVRGARAAYLGLLALAGVLFLAACGFVIVHVALLILLPPACRGWVLLGLGLVYLGLAVTAIAITASERRWMQAARGTDLLDWALRRRPRR